MREEGQDRMYLCLYMRAAWEGEQRALKHTAPLLLAVMLSKGNQGAQYSTVCPA